MISIEAIKRLLKKEDMKYSITLRNLPFEPEVRQVIYVENLYDEHINTIIKDNYDWLKWTFKQANLDFIYLPMFFNDEDIKEKILYYAPYLTPEIIDNAELRSSYLLEFMSHIENRDKICPSFLYGPREENGEWVFLGQPIEIGRSKNSSSIKAFFSEIISGIEEEAIPSKEFEDWESEFKYDDSCEDFGNVPSTQIAKEETPTSSHVEYSSTGGILEKLKRSLMKYSSPCLCEEEDYIPSGKKGLQNLEDIREEEVEDILKSLDKTIERLRLLGLPLAAIHELIDKRETVSRLYITLDYRIYLPDYNDKEVKMSPLFKAVYFLFLNNPKGIILKRLEEHHNELANYYRQMSKVDELTPKMIERINQLEDPRNNNLNIVLAKIRAAFIGSFDEHLAKHYVITGKAGDLYRIPLSEDLIVFEEEDE